MPPQSRNHHDAWRTLFTMQSGTVVKVLLGWVLASVVLSPLIGAFLKGLQGHRSPAVGWGRARRPALVGLGATTSVVVAAMTLGGGAGGQGPRSVDPEPGTPDRAVEATNGLDADGPTVRHSPVLVAGTMTGVELPPRVGNLAIASPLLLDVAPSLPPSALVQRNLSTRATGAAAARVTEVAAAPGDSGISSASSGPATSSDVGSVVTPASPPASPAPAASPSPTPSSSVPSPPGTGASGDRGATERRVGRPEGHDPGNGGPRSGPASAVAGRRASSGANPASSGIGTAATSPNAGGPGHRTEAGAGR